MHDLRELKDAGDAGADDEHRAEVELQKLTDARIAELDDGAEGQGSRDPRGLIGRRTAARRGTSPSSPTATAAGRRQRGLPVDRGHQAGADVVKARLRDAAEFGIRELTVYSFSTENWSRPAEEVTALMRMFSQRIADRDARAQRRGRAHALHRPPRARRRRAARADGLGRGARRRPTTASRSTSPSTTAGAPRSSMRRRATAAAGRRRSGSLLYAPEMHDPDLIIRTSGEQRMSNYLLWQAAYSELVFRRRAVARLLARGVPGRAGRVRAPPAPVRGALMEGAATSPPARDREPAARRARGAAQRAARTSARGWPPRSRRSRSRWRSSGFGNWVFVAGLVAARRASACTSCSRCTPSPTRRGWPASSGAIGAARGRAPRRPGHRAGRLRGLRAVGLPARACCSRATPARPGWR